MAVPHWKMAQVACNLLLPDEDNIPNKFRILKERHIQMIKLHQLPASTRPTTLPRSGIELTTSRLHSFTMAKMSHALNHSAVEAAQRLLFSSKFVSKAVNRLATWRLRCYSRPRWHWRMRKEFRPRCHELFTGQLLRNDHYMQFSS